MDEVQSEETQNPKKPRNEAVCRWEENHQWVLRLIVILIIIGMLAAIFFGLRTYAYVRAQDNVGLSTFNRTTFNDKHEDDLEVNVMQTSNLLFNEELLEAGIKTVYTFTLPYTVTVNNKVEKRSVQTILTEFESYDAAKRFFDEGEPAEGRRYRLVNVYVFDEPEYDGRNADNYTYAAQKLSNACSFEPLYMVFFGIGRTEVK